MSNQYTQAADDIRTLAGRFRNIMSLADALDGLGSIEQATKEATAARDKAQAERDALVKRNAAETAQVEADVKKVLDEADAYVAGLKAKTIAECEALVRAAQADAKEIINNANAGAMNTTATADRAYKAALDKIKPLTAKAEALEDEIAELSEQVNALTASKTNLQAAIDDMRAKFG